MKPQNKKPHLSGDDIAKAVVDREALPDDLKAHLEACSNCAERLARLEGRLEGMALMARHSSPAPTRPFRLPPKNRTAPFWQRKSILAAGISAMLLLAVVVWRPLWYSAPPLAPNVAFDAVADRRLMEDIDAIVDNALPEAYQQVASFSTPDFSDDADSGADPFDWIVPSLTEDEEDDFLS